MKDTKKLLSSSFIMFVGTTIASVFSYLFNMIMGRLLGPVQYGEFSVIMSILMIVSIGGGAILTITMRYAGELYHQKSYALLKKIFNVFSQYVLILSLILFVLGVIFTKPVSQFLQINYTLPVILAFSNFIFGFLVLVNKGFLQGVQKFVPVALAGIIEMVIRLVLGIVLVKMGLSLTGAILALLLAGPFCYIFTLWQVNKIFKSTAGQKTNETLELDKKEILSYSWPTVITMGLLVISLNIDVIMIKHFFTLEDAGIYAAISTVGKIILYVTSPIVSVMFPMISEKRMKGEKHYRLFIYSILITLVGGIAIEGLYIVMPGFVMKVLYGQAYVSLYHLLPEVGLFMLSYTMVNIVVNYYLSIKNFIFVWAFALIIALQIILISLWHPSILAVVRTLASTTLLFFIIMMAYYLFLRKDQILQIFKANNEKAEAFNNNPGV